MTDDEFVEDIIMGFLQADTINSHDLAEQLQSLVGDKAVPFIEKLWPLLEDAQNSETGIPSVFVEEAKRKIAERLKSNQNISNKLDESESSSSYTSSSSYNSSSSSSDAETTDLSKDQMHNNAEVKAISNQPTITQNTPIKPKILPSKPLKPPVIPPRNVKKQELKPILIENTKYPYNEENSSELKQHHSNHQHGHHHSHNRRRHDSSSSSSYSSSD
ncbi:hypothetical protein TVAG_317000 [Trichomonas vaginalis G3]|uniref:PWI domain-containing protein n=1 Tax=Trichomonas vaginalis (strain ATCC PRA-98 / G3) TaxID=412133 RepID=A2F076_TRIV3|nr:PWI domain family [Trichomonas vaginalis G3]EAY01711.1 hypothetical protein TVAG_317000 [Trichomonas vaginalis G3]KAI5489643.1 PWI domain family [Trichomonas vaginalis G3]|eukprot:XP_001330407.1 hypothetical protein [Trichomonas vaginalis G3]